MKIAYFSPMPPLKTGIAVYSSHLVPYLAKISKIEIFHAGHCDNFPKIKTTDFIKNPGELKRLGDFDAIIYHIGNNPWYHLDIYKVFLEYSGTVILHDAVLYYLIAGLGIGGLIKEFSFNYGLDRLSEIWDIIEECPERDILRYQNPEKYPFLKRILESARQIIVHSHSTFRLIRLSGYSGNLNVVNLPYYPNQVQYTLSKDTDNSRAKLGITENEILIGIFGFIGPTKRIDKLLAAIYTTKHKNKIPFKLLIVGAGDDLNEVIEQYHLSENIISLGFTSDDDFNRYLNLSDIVINLRYPSMGEASATLIQAMSYGKPVIVTNYAWFSELPDNTVVKVGFGSTEINEVAQAITELITNKEYRESIGSNAKAYVENFCAPAQVANKYLDILKNNLKPLPFLDFEPKNELPLWVLEYFQRKIGMCVPK